jgi:hypothetical protein
MPLGATPDWPWISSQNPTPVIVTLPFRSVNDEEEIEPQLAKRRVELDVSAAV